MVETFLGGQMMFHKLWRCLVVGWIVFGASVAHAQIPTTDIASLVQRVLMIASEYAQEAELVEQVEQTYNVVKQTTDTAKSLQNQLGSALNTDQSGDLQSILNAARAANAANGLLNSNSASGVMQQLQSIYKTDSATGRPDYDTYMGLRRIRFAGRLPIMGRSWMVCRRRLRA